MMEQLLKLILLVFAGASLAGTTFLWASLIYAAWNAPCSDPVWNALALVCAFR